MAMIHRASKICKLNSVENFDTSAFSDLNKVSNWAMPSVEFNIQNQLIVGDNLLTQLSHTKNQYAP